MPLNDVYKEGNMGGVIVDGRIESGTLKIGDQVCSRPGNDYGLVKGNSLALSTFKSLLYALDIQLDSESVDWSMVGDHVQVTLTGIDIQKLRYFFFNPYKFYKLKI